jgi:hypothetical protein
MYPWRVLLPRFGADDMSEVKYCVVDPLSQVPEPIQYTYVDIAVLVLSLSIIQNQATYYYQPSPSSGLPSHISAYPQTNMPLATIHLVSLKQDTTIPSFIQILNSTPLQEPPLVISKVIRWIITPTKIDTNTLLHPSKPWDLLLILPGPNPLPANIQHHLECHWTTTAGIPSRLTKTFPTTNKTLLHPPPSTIPALTGALTNPRIGNTSQTLELSPPLQDWISTFSTSHTGQNAMSMLNLLAFKPGMKDSYLKYGKAFSETIGAKRGGNAKLVGHVISDDGVADRDGGKWDEFALAHYPSILHFADMLASEDYQAVNLRFRVPALEDTLILCTSEVEIEGLVGMNGKTKL